jgi:hypothetical protein
MEMLQKPTEKEPCLFLHMDQKSDVNELSDKNIKNNRKTRQRLQDTKAGDTLSSRHVSSCDVTRAFGM